MYITQTKNESVEIINEMLSEYNLPALRVGEVEDWGIVGGETIAKLQEWVKDFVSEVHTERCESRQAWRYTV